MEKRKLKFNNYIFYLIIIIIVILILIFGTQRDKQTEVAEEVEESVGSGFLEVQTFPSEAEIFIDDVYSGKSPVTLYNVPAGSHNVVIKKSGYEDFISGISIEAGKKFFLEARLTATSVVEEETEIIETDDEMGEEKEETLEDINVINIGNKFLLYYDFSEGEFADKRNYEQDIFSKRYADHLVFTRLDIVNIKTIDKKIDDVEKDDCIGIRGQYEWLYSGQSLCVITKEGLIVTIGGTWEDTINAELSWKVFS